MAKQFRLLSVGSILSVVTLLAAAGCQSNQSLVDNLPTPNFNGPIVSAPLAPPPMVATNAPSPSPLIARRALASEKAWVPWAPARDWKWIVVHHSATPSGSAAEFDKMHRAKGWDELGYHFVIGNGTGSGNGQIEVGPRWPKQKWGAHAKTPNNEYNEQGIGICLVGNFDIERPTPQQMASLAKLTAYLMRTYHISQGNVLGHRDTKPTDCPGKNLNIAIVRRSATQLLADAGDSIDNPDQSKTADAGTELLVDEPVAASASR